MNENLPDKALDKIPNFESFKKNEKSGTFYVFLIIFFCYFIYNEFVRREDCDKRIETMEKSGIYKDQMIDQLTKRVSILETALDVEKGVTKIVITKADSLINK